MQINITWRYCCGLFLHKLQELSPVLALVAEQKFIACLLNTIAYCYKLELLNFEWFVCDKTFLCKCIPLVNEELLFNLCTYEVRLQKERGRTRVVCINSYITSDL